MNRVRIDASELNSPSVPPRSDVTKHELWIVMRTLITGKADDVQRLRELDILNDLPDDESGIETISRVSWM